jgi:hypothetical protein
VLFILAVFGHFFVVDEEVFEIFREDGVVRYRTEGSAGL